MANPIPNLPAAHAYIAALPHPPEVKGDNVRIHCPCDRCGGSGYTGHFQDGGICYGCWGENTRNRYQSINVLDWARSHRSKAAAAAKKAAAKAQRAAENEVKKIEAQRDWCEKQGHGRITFAELDERRAAATPEVPTGRLEITGEVVKTAYHGSAFGQVLKMTVKTTAGWLCWGTAPDSLQSVPEIEVYLDDHGNVCGEQTWMRGLRKGDKVVFTATIKPSDRDSKFGIFSRPSNARVIPGEPIKTSTSEFSKNLSASALD